MDNMLMDSITITREEAEVSRPKVAAPETSDPATLIRHLQAYEPVKLALARDLPLTVRKIEKTARGIKAMMKEEEGEETLHKGLGWLHYRTSLDSR
jgi:U3 small nucleolar RNA-associated protein 3